MRTAVITKRFRFEAAHRLLHHMGASSNLHGHSYKVNVTVMGEIQESGHEYGMVMDEQGLSSSMQAILNDGNYCGTFSVPFDHSVMLQTGDSLIQCMAQATSNEGGHPLSLRVVEMLDPPTPEAIAILLASLLQQQLIHEDKDTIVVKVKVWETEDYCAEWGEFSENNSES